MSRILIVEDEAHLADGLRFNLEAEGHEVDIDGDGQQALDRLLANRSRYDAVVLDVMLPGKDGFSVVKQLRTEGHYVPVLMLTARSRPEDVLHGFESGADDYLPKPFELNILMARLRGLLRRREWLAQEHEHEQITFAGARARTDHVCGQASRSRGARAPRRRQEIPADANGMRPAAIPRQERRQGGIAEINSRRRVGFARRHRHAGDR
jgi:DNA-binding response OmpR family regulator